MPPGTSKSGDPLADKWRQPRYFSRLHRQLSRLFAPRREQITFGFACQRCRAKKIKCDGERPCAKCVASNYACVGVEREEDASSSQNDASSPPTFGSRREETIDPEFPVSSPDFYTLGSTAYSVVHASHSRVSHPFFKKMCNIGLPPDAISKIVDNLPPSLSLALKLLADRASSMPPNMAGKIASPLETDLQSYIPLFPGCLRSVHALNPVDGTALGVSFSRRLGELFGAHGEELAARVFNQEMPIPQLSEYRVICYVLQSIHDSIFPHKAVGCVDALKWGSIHGTSRIAFVRITFRSVQQAGIMTHSIHDGCEISPQDFDSHRSSSSPPHGTTFLQCSRPSAEFIEGGYRTVEEKIFEKESIRSMMASEEGRAKLQRLECMVVDNFGLNSPLPSAQHSGLLPC